jgi:hypothetical protein
MKPTTVISAAVLLLFLGSSGMAYARQEQHGQGGQSREQRNFAPREQFRPQRNFAPREQFRPQQNFAPREQFRPQRNFAPREQFRPQQNFAPREQFRPQRNFAPREQFRPQRNFAPREQFRAGERSEPRERFEPQERFERRGGYNGYYGRIPYNRFSANFGHNHFFHINNVVFVGGYPRFWYGGYWFTYADEWPVGWYYGDPFYVDYFDGGYYLYNPRYPGARFAINVVF